MKKWWRRVRPEIIPRVGYWVARLLALTIRFRTVGKEKVKGVTGGLIYCGWHGRSYGPGMMFRKQGMWVIISHSRDGEMQNRIFTRLGFNVIRGSTGRGGVRAAIEAIRELKKGAKMAITPDGPRGPNGVVQGGVILMAQKSGAALVPLGISARPRYLAHSWDRYMIPYPFSKLLVVYGDPLYVPKDATEEEAEAIRQQLELRIHELTADADRRLGIEPNPIPAISQACPRDEEESVVPAGQDDQSNPTA